MMTNGRTAPKSPGRTPPFILVGLLVLLCVLAYNYWTLSARNSDLTGMTEKLRSEATSVAAAHESVQKSLEEAQEKLKVTEGNLDQVRQTLKEKEAELENLQAEMSKLQTESSKYQEDLASCQASFETQKADMEKLRGDAEGEISNLKTQPCEMARCTAEIKNVLQTISKVINPASIKQALDNAQLDSNSLLGPIPENPNPPAAGAANVPPPSENGQPNADAKAPPPPQNNEAPPVNDADQVEGKPESTNFTNPKVVPHSAEAAIVTAQPLVFQPDENNSTEKKQIAIDEKENSKDIPMEVVNQIIGGDDLKLTKEVNSTEAYSDLDIEDLASSTEEPRDKGK